MPVDVRTGDYVVITSSRHNPHHHNESYKVGEHGMVVGKVEGSSVVTVRLEGEYYVVESTLPLLSRHVPDRIINASVLHLKVIRADPRREGSVITGPAFRMDNQPRRLEDKPGQIADGLPMASFVESEDVDWDIDDEVANALLQKIAHKAFEESGGSPQAAAA
mmetsp:Transcript_123143/g.223837  ORF Transcript_123143/g.223837 Transcript_123143/m.223837 type:complete len:163 (-) Transcript_123143:74-562(-)